MASIFSNAQRTVTSPAPTSTALQQKPTPNLAGGLYLGGPSGTGAATAPPPPASARPVSTRPMATPSGYIGPKTLDGGATYNPDAAARAFAAGNIGGVGGAANMTTRPAPAPAAGATPARAEAAPGTYATQDIWKIAGVDAGRSEALGAGLQQQGAGVAAGQQNLANAFNARGQGFSANAMQQASRFGVGDQIATGGGPAAPGALSTAQLGAISQVAGQLGGGYQVGSVGGIAGQLGAAPTVGQVGNIQMQAGPGGIAGQLGNQGAQNADQAGMLARLNGFLDSPEGPSVAEAQLQQAQAGNMANLIGAARSGRGGAGAQAQALRGAMSEGSAIMSDTAGQLATLRAQEADMQRNRQLSAIGLGGEMSTAARGQDLSFRGQDLQALQGDQGASIAARGQDLTAAMANQSTQTALEQLQAQTALGARGQNLSALQGDQGTALGLEGLRANTAVSQRGQDLGALTADQQASIAARGQNLSALQGNQATSLGARGQDVSRELGLANVNLGMRGQDAGVLMSDADRNLQAQRLRLDAGLGYGNLATTAQGQGLQYLSQANQQALGAQGLSSDTNQALMGNLTSMANQNIAGTYGLQQAVQGAQAGKPDQLSFGEQLALNTLGGIAAGGGKALAGLAFSDERAKEGIQGLDGIKAKLDEHLRAAPAHGYRYRPGFGEDPETERAGPMAQDLERSPFGRDIVKVGADGYRRVDTSRLALVNHAALSSMRSELDALKKQLEA